MRNIILFDNEGRDRLLPFTFLRPVADLRIGILTIREKWEHWLNGTASYITQEYLNDRFPISILQENFVINAGVLPSTQLVKLILDLDFNEALLKDGELIATKLTDRQFAKVINNDEIEMLSGMELGDTEFTFINRLPDIYLHNAAAIQSDFELITKGRTSEPISATNTILGDHPIFLEPGAKVEASILNASDGPIYIGKDAEIMEGCMVRGSFALGEHGVLKMGAKIYSGTSIGPWSKVGGEVSNSVIFAYANKGHDGFLGNSVLGEWVNIGADTNNSNLKNNYDEVKLWDYSTGRFEKTGQQFCGLFMGDHSKCGINTMFNTGTVVGISCNIFGEGFPRNFIPSFSWGGHHGYTTYKTDKAFETADRMMQRRNQEMGPDDRVIFLRVFEDTAKYRTWEQATSN